MDFLELYQGFKENNKEAILVLSDIISDINILDEILENYLQTTDLNLKTFLSLLIKRMVTKNKGIIEEQRLIDIMKMLINNNFSENDISILACISNLSTITKSYLTEYLLNNCENNDIIFLCLMLWLDQDDCNITPDDCSQIFEKVISVPITYNTIIIIIKLCSICQQYDCIVQCSEDISHIFLCLLESGNAPEIQKFCNVLSQIKDAEVLSQIFSIDQLIEIISNSDISSSSRYCLIDPLHLLLKQQYLANELDSDHLLASIRSLAILIQNLHEENPSDSSASSIEFDSLIELTTEEFAKENIIPFVDELTQNEGTEIVGLMLLASILERYSNIKGAVELVVNFTSNSDVYIKTQAFSMVALLQSSSIVEVNESMDIITDNLMNFRMEIIEMENPMEAKFCLNNFYAIVVKMALQFSLNTEILFDKIFQWFNESGEDLALIIQMMVMALESPHGIKHRRWILETVTKMLEENHVKFTGIFSIVAHLVKIFGEGAAQLIEPSMDAINGYFANDQVDPYIIECLGSICSNIEDSEENSELLFSYAPKVLEQTGSPTEYTGITAMNTFYKIMWKVESHREELLDMLFKTIKALVENHNVKLDRIIAGPLKENYQIILDSIELVEENDVLEIVSIIINTLSGDVYQLAKNADFIDILESLIYVFDEENIVDITELVKIFLEKSAEIIELHNPDLDKLFQSLTDFFNTIIVNVNCQPEVYTELYTFFKQFLTEDNSVAQYAYLLIAEMVDLKDSSIPPEELQELFALSLEAVQSFSEENAYYIVYMLAKLMAPLKEVIPDASEVVQVLTTRLENCSQSRDGFMLIDTIVGAISNYRILGLTQSISDEDLFSVIAPYIWPKIDLPECKPTANYLTTIFTSLSQENQALAYSLLLQLVSMPNKYLFVEVLDCDLLKSVMGIIIKYSEQYGDLIQQVINTPEKEMIFQRCQLILHKCSK